MFETGTDKTGNLMKDDSKQFWYCPDILDLIAKVIEERLRPPSQLHFLR